MPDPIATAFVLVRPETTGFTAQLTAELNRAVAVAQRSVKPIVVPITTTGGRGLGAISGAGSSAERSLRRVGSAGGVASKGLQAAENEANLARGALIGLARVTPVAVFGLGVIGTLAVGIGLAARSAIRSTAELQKELNIFNAVSGATQAQMAVVSDTVRQLGADLSLPATSAQDAAVGLTELAKAGLSIEDSLAGVRGVLQLATAAEIGVADAAKIVSTQLNAFGLPGDQATRVVNLLAAASISAQGEITDFAAAFQQVDSVARTAGLSIEQTTALLTLLAKAGLRGADGGTSLRTTLLRLVPTTKEAQKYMHALGVEFDATQSIGAQLPSIVDQLHTALGKLNNRQQIEALNQIFGQDAFRAASIIFGSTSKELEALQDSLSGTDAAAKLAEAQTKGLSGAIEGLKSQAETLGTTVGTGLLPLMEDLVDTLSDITSGATNAAEGLSKITSPVTGGLGAIGGGEATAHIAIAAAIGLTIRHLINKRGEAAKTAAAARAASTSEVASAASTNAALERQLLAHGAIDLSYVKNAQSAGASAEKQILDARGIALANEKAAAASARAWAASAKRIAAGNKLMIAAILADFAASGLGQTSDSAGVQEATGIVSTAASALLTGTLIGGPALGIPLAAGSVFASAFSASKSENARNQQEWDKLTYMEQVTFLRDHFKWDFQAQEFLKAWGFKMKANPSPAPKIGFGLGGFLDRTFKAGQQPAKLPDALTAAAVLGPRDRIDLEISKARAGNNLPALEKALEERVIADNQILANLYRSLQFGLGNRKKIAEQIKRVQEDLQQTLADMFSSFEDPALNPTFAAIELQGIDASATETLVDDIKNDQLEVAARQQELALALLGGVKGAPLHEIRKSLATAQAELTRDQRALADQQERDAKEAKSTAKAAADKTASDAANAKAAAEHALDVQEENLRFLAEAAGFQGKAEEAYLAFLNMRLNAAQGNQEEINAARGKLAAATDQRDDAFISALREVAGDFDNVGRAEARLVAGLKKILDNAKRVGRGVAEAQRNYNEELKNQAQAFASAVQSSLDLQFARLDTKLINALRTPGTDDEERIYRQQLDILERKRKNAQALANKARQGSEDQRRALRDVNDLDAQIINLNNTIADLGKTGGSAFTLNDLFKAAAEQFNEFGSNISQSPTTAGGARTSLAGNILAQKPDNLAAVVSSKADTQIQEAKTSNEYLKIIADHMVNLGLGTPDKPKKTGGGGVSAAVAAAKYANAGIGSD